LKPRVLLFGKELSQDQELSNLLQNKVELFILQKSEQLISEIQKLNIDLVVFEFSKMWEKSLQVLKNLKSQFKQIDIVIVDGNDSKEAIIRSFQIGVDDYFKKPYKCHLLAERIEALLKRKI